MIGFRARHNVDILTYTYCIVYLTSNIIVLIVVLVVIIIIIIIISLILVLNLFYLCRQ